MRVPDLAAAAQKAAANLEQVAQAHLAIAILVQQAAQQAAAQTALLLCVCALLPQHLAQTAGVHAAGVGALRQKCHHDGGQHLQQGPRLRAQACGLAQTGLRALLVAAKNMPQDGCTTTLASALSTAEQ